MQVFLMTYLSLRCADPTPGFVLRSSAFDAKECDARATTDAMATGAKP